MIAMKSIRSKALLAVAISVPFGVPAMRSSHPPVDFTTPLPPAQTESANLGATSSSERAATLLVDAVIQIESNGDALKVGRHGERGLMQIKAGTWRDTTARLFGEPLSFDRAFDPALNRRVGTAYLAFLHERILLRKAEWKSDERALLLAAYNAGPGRLRRAGYSLAGMPRQTRDYVLRAAALHDVYLADMAPAVRRLLLASLAAPGKGI